MVKKSILLFLTFIVLTGCDPRQPDAQEPPAPSSIGTVDQPTMDLTPADVVKPPATREDLMGIAAFCWANPRNCQGKGDPNAPLVMVEISDYGCGHCRNFNLETVPLIEDSYIESGEVYWLVLPYSLSPQRIPLPASALCAADQDAFYDYHAKMFEIFNDQDAGTLAGLKRAAAEIGLDMTAFSECVESGRHQDLVQQNMTLASALGVNSTPTIFVGEKAAVGNYPFEAISQWIDQALAAQS